MERIQLGNTIFEGSNAVYLLGHETDGPTTLVDTGVAFPEVEAQLRDGLADSGVAVADLDQILLTHYHQDHAGLAGAFQAESGATVRVHEADAALVARESAALDAQAQRYRAAFERWEMPQDRRADLFDIFESGDAAWSSPAAEVTPLRDGDVVAAGDHKVEVLHLPGHSAGQSGFLDRAADRLFAGDAVLPRYTPNVGGADVRVDRPLATYVASLERLLDVSPDRIMPGHRVPIDEPAARVRDILSHHRDRTATVVDLLREHGPADAWTVSAHLFGDLEHIHILHGPGEAAAHLDHLVEAGVVEQADGIYDLAVPDVSVDDVIPGSW
ncbi:MAG: MBL fold metallo-hydrolase [Haloarculaceae archaeon]